jgi:hypothetical protein
LQPQIIPLEWKLANISITCFGRSHASVYNSDPVLSSRLIHGSTQIYTKIIIRCWHMCMPATALPDAEVLSYNAYGAPLLRQTAKAWCRHRAPHVFDVAPLEELDPAHSAPISRTRSTSKMQVLGPKHRGASQRMCWRRVAR